MITIQQLKADPQQCADQLLSRGFRLDVATATELASRFKSLSMDVEDARARLSRISEKIGELMKRGGEAAESVAELRNEAHELRHKIALGSTGLDAVSEDLYEFWLSIPNTTQAVVPKGSSEADNVEIRRWMPGPMGDDGNPLPPHFEVKDHVDIGNQFGLAFEKAAKLSGARFTAMIGPLATLHRALATTMVNFHLFAGYQECYTPYIVDTKPLYGTGQLPKFKDDMFEVSRADGRKQYLIPTSEITMTNFVANTLVKHDDLPIKLVAHTPCFRSEAGSAGRDTRGLIRQHQFDKVELVNIVHPDNSEAAHSEMLQQVESLLQLLKLPYRVVMLCAGDMGFSAAKTYDIEVWFPAQKAWREISSISNCEDFQARRMNARIEGTSPKLPVHTLNGSGVAVGRALAAALENWQTADGKLKVPSCIEHQLGHYVKSFIA